jgi:hypothetical protein
MHNIICIKATTNGATMRICRLYPVQAEDRHKFKWEWRSERCDRRSSRKFDFFYDCMEDARSHGFRVILQHPIGETSPTHYSLACLVPVDSLGGPARPPLIPRQARLPGSKQ